MYDTVAVSSLVTAELRLKSIFFLSSGLTFEGYLSIFFIDQYVKFAFRPCGSAISLLKDIMTLSPSALVIALLNVRTTEHSQVVGYRPSQEGFSTPRLWI